TELDQLLGDVQHRHGRVLLSPGRVGIEHNLPSRSLRAARSPSLTSDRPIHRVSPREEGGMRGSRRAALGVALAVVLMAMAVPWASASPGEWPMFMFNRPRSGFNASETVITAATAATLHVVWTAPASDAVSPQPVTKSGTIFWGSSDG